MSEDSTAMVIHEGILRELYAISAEYQATVRRLRGNGVSDDDMSLGFYYSAMRAYVASIPFAPVGTPEQRKQVREAAIGLGVIAARLARRMRVQ
jgi:hypothetical protein